MKMKGVQPLPFLKFIIASQDWLFVLLAGA